jgi:YVTN family beta-propeller protein
MDAGTDGEALGTTKHAMDFAADSWVGEVDLGPTLYLANQDEGAVYLFNYDDVNWDWVPVKSGDPPTPVTIATGTGPSGVKVQTVLDDTYVYIANADDDTVTVVNTATNDEIEDSPVPMNSCNGYGNVFSAIGTRSSGDFAYISNSATDSLSVVDLSVPECTIPQNGIISTGTNSSPADIVVQPVPDATEFFEQMLGMMIFSAPEDYDALDAQIEMIGDWKAIRQLELTPASPQAIKAALSAYLNKIDQKVCKDKLKKHMKQAVKLYRAAYLHEHPGN